ncbi:hypothetical protein VP01_610g5 [Puccinia sorghi]|uniref:Uncharacterized protein n=1 Tax=Puccinia sorghi TaxID=27349 RepID=A0A0L6UH03_9BASI|nr:hypothetical protein VP01_610g5 [Puccinia sorghi]
MKPERFHRLLKQIESHQIFTNNKSHVVPSYSRPVFQHIWVKSPHHLFNGAIALADRKSFPLAFAPTVHKEDYWIRKNVCEVNLLIMCSCNWWIIYALHGQCGSQNDQSVSNTYQILPDTRRG